MYYKINLENTTRDPWTIYSFFIKAVLIISLIFTGLMVRAQGQPEQYTKPSWWFGGAVGANVNFYRGSTQKLNDGLTVPTAFHNGTSAGLYLAPLVEFHRPDSRWGVMLQTGYDSRMGSYNHVTNPCNCPAYLSTDLSYVSVEPSLRFAPFKKNFYLFGGPRIAFNLTKAFTYELGTNPEFPNQPPNPDIKGDLSDINKTLVSGQIGMGYDIPFSTKQDKRAQWMLSPFVSFQPYYGQDPRSIETWNITTVRIGLAFKGGRGHKIGAVVVEPVKMPEVETQFTVTAPKNIPVEHRVRETFPLRNYIFFNLGSTTIADRYVLLRKDQVKDFKEDQLEVFAPKNLSGRSARQMTVYYNIINILGDRLGKNPNATITLVGSSEKGPDDGRLMAESVKQYLVDVFGINPARINIQGREKPKLPSEQPGGNKELDLLREGDRRVSIESNSADLLMEFQSGPDAALKSIEIIRMEESIDSNITFNVAGANEAFTSWSLEVKDEKGKVQNFGPFTGEKVSIPVRDLLGSRSEGDYKIKMVGKTLKGKIVKKETPVHLVAWTSPKIEEEMRFSVLFEFNESKAITLYEKYLTDIVAPKIPVNGTVTIHGHTDIIGEEAYNQTLSMARAVEVKGVLEKALAKAGRTDVKFEVNGFGEDENLSPFENKTPEERFYNRTVIIDIK